MGGWGERGEGGVAEGFGVGLALGLGLEGLGLGGEGDERGQLGGGVQAVAEGDGGGREDGVGPEALSASPETVGAERVVQAEVFFVGEEEVVWPGRAAEYFPSETPQPLEFPDVEVGGGAGVKEEVVLALGFPCQGGYGLDDYSCGGLD